MLLNQSIHLVPQKCLKIQYYLIVEIHEFWTICDIAQLLIELVLFGVLLMIGQILIQVHSKPLDLVPDGIKLLKIVFEDLVLGSFDGKFIAWDDNLIDLKILFFPDKDLINQTFHHIRKHVNNDLMETPKGLKLDDVGWISLNDRGYSLEAVLNDVKKDIGGLVGVRADDRNVEQLLLVFG